MAAFHSAAAAAGVIYSIHSSDETRSPRKLILQISCLSPSFPSKPTRRENRLRQKFLKTLETSNLPKPPSIPNDSPLLQEMEESGTTEEEPEFNKREHAEAGNEESEQLGEVEVSGSAGNRVEESTGVFHKTSFLKYGMWLVGAFVFHTVCAIWVFGSSVNDNKNGMTAGNDESSGVEVGGNGLQGNRNGKLGVKNSGVDSIIYVDELEMERKIEEIQVMAREVREKERLESNKNGYDSETEEEMDGEKHSKSGIEEEVSNRLVNLSKKLQNTWKKMPVASVNYSKTDVMRQDAVENNEPDEIGSNGAMLLPKKYKFKHLLTDSVEKPKGFTGSDGYVVSKSGEQRSSEKGNELLKSGSGDNRAVGLGDGEKPPDLDGVGPKGDDVEEGEKKGRSNRDKYSKNARGNGVREKGMDKRGKGKDISNQKVTDGSAMGKNNGRSALGTVKFRKVTAKTSKPKKPNDLDISVASKLSRGNYGSTDEEIGGTELEVESKTETDMWWLNLPYVLVIVMRRGDDGEGVEGFYTLRSLSSSEDQISHMVAFEDQGDATNFCYLLQSFFEDLEDFQAHAVPFTIKDLNEAVKQDMKRVIVVKRGQLRLYAGQPLVDTEMALRALIKQG